jgi:hypothetical protein
MGIRETEFHQHFPTFTEVEAIETFRTTGEIVSMAGRAGVPNLYVVMFASRTKKYGPFALNPLVARVLHDELAQFLGRVESSEPRR